MTMANKDDKQRRGLARLDELDDFKVADGDPDVRGWDVVASDGRKIGEVKHLIADTGQMRVRYLEVELERDLQAGGTETAGDDRNALIPIGAVRLNDDKDDVIVDSLSSVEFGAFPAFASGGDIDRDYEASVASRFGGAAGSARGAASGAATSGAATSGRDRDDDFYADDRFDDSRYQKGIESRRLTLSEEQLKVGKRQREAGEVELRKTVETEHVSESVPVTREEVRVERRPLSAGDVDATNATIGEDEIRVPLMAEEVVVDKRVVPTEEIVIRKEAVTEERNVEADVRRERLVVDKDSDVDVNDRR
jgi:uncharacterized protein (TIGR02271 family)